MQQQGSVLLIRNIPSSYHSADLRKFFVDFIEKEAFSCFHFRHRPEYDRIKLSEESKQHDITNEDGVTGVKCLNNGQPNLTDTEKPHNIDTYKPSSDTVTRGKSLCCVVQVKNAYIDQFIDAYNGKHWTDVTGNQMRQKVRVVPLNTCDSKDTALTNQITSAIEQLHVQDIASLPELNPPNLMPQGNVGTPISVFMKLIRTCKLPCHVIKKLKLNFPTAASKRKGCYGAVPMEYMQSGRQGVTLRDMKLPELGIDKDECPPVTKKFRSDDDEDLTERNVSNEDTGELDDYGAEEWERYEALHDDVDKQERSSERLFENEMEVVWDKGGSGLVFYTDASYWDEQDGDFDEKCSKEDDWDVDMSLYYGYSSGDRTAQEMRKMAIEKQFREGNDTETVHWKGKEGFGGKLLKRKGWKEGSGLGVRESGISEPLDVEGQHPTCKKGLGYRGEKLLIPTSGSKKVLKTKDVLISTVYDKPEEEIDSVARRAPTTTLKYRQKYVTNHKRTS